MSIATQTTKPAAIPAGRRFLRAFLWTAGSIVAAVAAINLITFAFVSQPGNQQVAQLVIGWERTLKPLLYETVKPRTAAFGASWVRDAFDPLALEGLTGERFFNFGISGGKPYEARRFLDSALASAPPAAVVLNLDSFFDRADANRTAFSFNEDLLRTREDGSPNPWAPLHRAYSLTLSGASMGFNAVALTALARIAGGADPKDVLASYQRLDFDDWRPALAELGTRMLGMPATTENAPFPDQRRSGSGTLSEFNEIVESLCANDIAVHTYFTPHHMLRYACSAKVDVEMQVLATLREAAAACKRPPTYHVFAYPNAVTMEGIAEPADRSIYYRPDGHPRPTVGLLMAARMLGTPFPEGTLRQDADFGTDLVAMSDKDARDWLLRRKARCGGKWLKDDLERVLRDTAG